MGRDESVVEFFKKAITVGQKAGLTLDQIFDLLETGMVIGTVLKLIELRLTGPPAELRSSRWIPVQSSLSFLQSFCFFLLPSV